MKHRYVSSLLLIASLCATAQTKVDLGKQSKDVDFSQASAVRPFPIGVALPATCLVGQMFFLTTAPAGANECVSNNVWQPVQGTGATAKSPIGVSLTNSTLLTIGSGCSLVSPCLYRIGSSVFSLLAPATVTLTGGSGLTYIYFDTNGNLTVGISASGSPAVTCAGCVVVPSVTQYPVDTIQIETWNATNGVWDGSGTNDAALLGVPAVLVAGANITLAESNGTITISAGDAGSSGSSSGGSGSGSTSTYNPADPTQFFRHHLSLVSGFNEGADGWAYNGGCASGSGSGARGFSLESIFPAVWAQAPASGTCTFYFPSSISGTYGTNSYDYWSGSTPSKLYVSATYATMDTNGTHYIGLSADANISQDFIGCRQSGAGDWFAVIRAGGVDIATADTGIAHDTATHRLVVDNNGGTPNTIRCSVDGANTATANGTIPGEFFGWLYLYGAIATSPAAVFAPFEYIIFLQGLPRQ